MSTPAPAFPTLSIRGVTARTPFVLAPMDGYTDLPFRLMCRRGGAGMICTEMIPGIALDHDGRDAARRMRISDEERPVSVQIVGNDPVVMARAALIVQDGGADIVDINAGCPSRKVTNGGSGSALLSDLTKLARILEAVRKVVTVPLTLKVRPGANNGSIVLEDLARIVHETGIDAVTLHARTRAQGFSGLADWRLITRFKALLRVPLIGNGDVVRGEDGIRMMRETGCDGVMVGRATIGEPWIFRELEAAWRGLPIPPKPNNEELRRLIVEHFDLFVAYVGGNEETAARVFRKHISRYVRCLPGAVALRRNLPDVTSRPRMLKALNEVLLT